MDASTDCAEQSLGGAAPAELPRPAPDGGPPAAPHPSRQTLARALSGTAEADEVRLSLLTHLIACCADCRRVVEELAELAHEYGHWDIAEAIAEWREAPRLWRRLSALAPAEQLAAVEADDDFWTWGLCRLLQLRSADAGAARPPQPATAAHLAALALRIAGNLGESYDLTWVRGLRALCLACLGNAHRLLGELHAAADAMATARHLLDAGVGNVAFEAEVLLVAGLVARDRRRLVEALGHLAAARAVLAPPDAALADPGLLAAVLAQQAWCRHHQGEPDAATDLLAEAAAFAGWAEPAAAASEAASALRWEIGLGQVWCALAAGDPGAAGAALKRLEEGGLATAEQPAAAEPTAGEPAQPAVREPVAAEPEPAQTAAGEPAPRAPEKAPAEPLPATGAEGAAPAALQGTLLLRPKARLAALAGERGRAREILQRAIGGLAAAGQGIEAALALLDLAALLVEEGAHLELAALAVHVIPDLLVPAPRDLQAGDLAALLLFQRACLAHHLGDVPTVANRLREAASAAAAEGGSPLAAVTAAGTSAATLAAAPAAGMQGAPPPSIPETTAPGRPAAPAGPPAEPQLTPERVHRFAQEIERRRRPALTWWSLRPPLFDREVEEEECHVPVEPA